MIKALGVYLPASLFGVLMAMYIFLALPLIVEHISVITPITTVVALILSTLIAALVSDTFVLSKPRKRTFRFGLVRFEPPKSGVIRIGTGFVPSPFHTNFPWR